jgi:hypothetical protein
MATMVWGEFQSIIQLAAGLNTAYFSFTELRQPAFAAERRALNVLRAAIEEKMHEESSALVAKMMYRQQLQLAINLNTIFNRYRWMDIYLGRSCLGASILYICLLFWSSFFSSSSIRPECAIGIFFLGFLPVSACLLANVAATQQVRKNVSVWRWKLEPGVLSLTRPNESPL